MEHNKRLKTSPKELLPMMNEQEKSKSHDVQNQLVAFIQGNNAADKSMRNPFVRELRHQAIAASSVDCNQSIPIDQLMTRCETLVKSNRALWNRYKPYCCQYTKTESARTDKCCFFRVHRYIEAYTEDYTSDSFNELILEAGPCVTKRCFEIPIRLPARLEQVVVNPRPDEDDIMPDFGILLRRSMLLIDDVVPMFLQEFKAFLERQEVALGKVEEWLFHKDEDKDFILRDANGEDVCWEYGDFFKINSCSPTDDFSKFLGACIKCNGKYEWHCQEDDGESCPSECEYDDGRGCFPLNHEKTELLRCSFPGTLEFKMSLEIAHERRWLSNFLEFVRSNEVKRDNKTKRAIETQSGGDY